MDTARLFRRNSLWTMALYAQSGATIDLPPSGPPAKLFPTKKLWRSPNHVHTHADPFLYVHNGNLFLFYEALAGEGPGWIEGYRTTDLVTFTPIGEVLREPFHISYPFVFTAGSGIYMIPETKAANRVQLYEFENFPKALRPVRTLLEGAYVDTSPVQVDGIWYLFTTSKRGLELFYTDDIVKGDLRLHRKSPITNDPRLSRCGGGPLAIGDSLFRLAQNCARVYGENVSLLEIEVLSPTEYRERVARENIFVRNETWNSAGTHHVSVAQFKGQTIVAVDGQEHEYYVHKISRWVQRLLQRQ